MSSIKAQLLALGCRWDRNADAWVEAPDPDAQARAQALLPNCKNWITPQTAAEAGSTVRKDKMRGGAGQAIGVALVLVLAIVAIVAVCANFPGPGELHDNLVIFCAAWAFATIVVMVQALRTGVALAIALLVCLALPLLIALLGLLPLWLIPTVAILTYLRGR